MKISNSDIRSPLQSVECDLFTFPIDLGNSVTARVASGYHNQNATTRRLELAGCIAPGSRMKNPRAFNIFESGNDIAAP